MLSQGDQDWLNEQGYDFDFSQEAGGLTNLILKGYRLPEGFEPEATDLLIRLPAGFPDMAPDMFWVDPPVKIKKSGALAPASDQTQTHAGRAWQRFSRHLAPGAWRPGIDSLQSWVIAIRGLLEKDVAP